MTTTTTYITKLSLHPFCVRVWSGDIGYHLRHQRKDHLQSALERWCRSLTEQPSQEDVAGHLLSLDGVTKVEVTDGSGQGVVVVVCDKDVLALAAFEKMESAHA